MEVAIKLSVHPPMVIKTNGRREKTSFVAFGKSKSLVYDSAASVVPSWKKTKGMSLTMKWFYQLSWQCIGRFLTTTRRPYIGVPKQWNSGHVGVANPSCGRWTVPLRKCFLLFQEICIDPGHVSETLHIGHQNDEKLITNSDDID